MIKVLLVDEDATTRAQLGSALRRGQCEVVSATDAASGWQVLQASDPPRIVVLDWSQRERESQELVARLRGREGAGACWLILTSSRDEHEARLAAFEAGGDDYLVKPVDAAELRARVTAAARLLTRIETLERELGHRRFAA
jgi:DNA-binding response OmpR family regulator